MLIDSAGNYFYLSAFKFVQKCQRYELSVIRENSSETFRLRSPIAADRWALTHMNIKSGLTSEVVQTPKCSKITQRKITYLILI